MILAGIRQGKLSGSTGQMGDQMPGTAPDQPGQPDLAAITRAASREAGGVPAGLLGGYLPTVLDAAMTGRRLTGPELAEHGQSGERAAEGGVALRGLVDLYLSATWRLWRELPGGDGSMTALRAAGLAVLRAADDAVAAAAEGFERAHLSVARRQEAERIEFLDDLLGGRGTMADLVARGTEFGLRLAGPHQVVLAASLAGPRPAVGPGITAERLVAGAVAPAPALAMTRGGRILAVVGVVSGDEARQAAGALATALGAAGPGAAVSGAAGGGEEQSWRVAIGRAYTGPAGVLRSYEEATDTLDIAVRLELADPVLDAGEFLMYRVILRDRAALADLVGALLTPLTKARDGAGPLLDTLESYYASGQVAAEAARRLHLSVRAVTYRLARVAQLTGKDPADPAEALGLQVAVVGARLLDWPARPLEPR